MTIQNWQHYIKKKLPPTPSGTFPGFPIAGGAFRIPLVGLTPASPSSGSSRFLERVLLNGVYRKLWNCAHGNLRSKKERIVKKVLTSTLQIIILSFRDRSERSSSSACAEASILLFRTVKSWRGCNSVLCSSAVHSSRFCECPGPRYSRAVFISDDMAV
jgi:hypothetical protein